jgi:Uncharacterised nucleotidyltransferase
VTQVPHELWPIACRLATSREWPPCGDGDATAFFNYVNGQKLLPLLLADDDLPAGVIAAKPRFRALEFLYRKRFELARCAILELQRVLGVEAFLFYKGSDYCHRLYDRPEFRPMADVDVYIPSAELPRALRKLEAAGYPRRYAGRGAAFSPWHHEIPVVIGGVLVELHRGFAQRVRAAIDYDGMWRRREWFERNGVGGYRLSPADAILGHAYGLAKDEFSSELSRFLDFYLLLQQCEDELDHCVKRAKDWQMERALFGALHLTSAMFADAKTSAVNRAIDALLDRPTRQFLVDKVLPDPTTEPSGWVSGRRIQIRRKFALMDRSWRRIAFVAHSSYATAVGSAFEWRARRKGVIIPPRSMIRPR